MTKREKKGILEEVLSTLLVMVQNDKVTNNTLQDTPPQDRETAFALEEVLTQGEILEDKENRITSESTVQTAKRTSPGTRAALSALLAKAGASK